VKFIQSLFKEYAQAGLSKESDREIAISGLLERMQHALESDKCRYGIFECLISRLLLWRVLGNVDGGTVNAGTIDHHLPSWSWMTHNRIEFFLDGKIKILEGGNIKFGSSSPELLTQIRRLQNYKIKQRGSQHVVQDNDNHDVGELWFDGQATTAEDCVIVGMQNPDNCLILLVSKKNDHHYQRVGAGQIKACCLSKDFWEGTIV
jgi:hypothetical protein